jgi:hypothetical protein
MKKVKLSIVLGLCLVQLSLIQGCKDKEEDIISDPSVFYEVMVGDYSGSSTEFSYDWVQRESKSRSMTIVKKGDSLQLKSRTTSPEQDYGTIEDFVSLSDGIGFNFSNGSSGHDGKITKEGNSYDGFYNTEDNTILYYKEYLDQFGDVDRHFRITGTKL